MNLTDPVTHLPGVGEAYAKRLEKLNIFTVQDLFDHFPFRYEDYSQVTLISKLAPDRPACIKAKLISFENIRTRSRITIQKALVEDSSGQVKITWFNQQFLENGLKKGEEYYFTGPVSQFKTELTLTSPDYEPVKETPIHTARLVPIYHETYGVSSKWLRHKIFIALNLVTFPDPLTEEIGTDFVSQSEAYHQIHFPNTLGTQQKAEARLSYNDLLSIYIKSELTKNHWQHKQTLPINLDQNLHQQFISSLDFNLTPDQQLAINQIFEDLQQNSPMNRLLQGDVGSGKTVVALASVLQVAKKGLQTLILAPTQVLATQHFNTFTKLLAPFEIEPKLITGHIKKRDPSNVLVGTHALLHTPEIIDNQKLALIIIDEQHRFGVLQRSHFLQQEKVPHVLTMSATPIPRTIALSIYGHLKISDIKTMPQGRIPIKTWVIPESKRKDSYAWIKNELKQGNQAFIVCPFIDTSESETLKNVKAATKEYEHLKTIFPDFKLQLLHGRLKPQQKDQILQDFRTKKFDILVSTPVIEVGVDIPSANIMVIEDASRFGLSQLHQLRGRVGRGDQQSYCLLFAGEATDSIPRLKLLEQHTSGLNLAEIDLKLRGAGDIFGSAQSGHLDTQFDQFWNKDLNAKAKKKAVEIVSKNKQKALAILESLNRSLAKLVSDN